MRAERVNILIVDDDEVSVMAIRRALDAHGVRNPVTVANDGLEALETLQRGAPPRPRVVLLDINMPRMTGLEFLAAIRGDASLRDAIVFVLSTSDTHYDLHAAYDHQVAGYIVKEDAYGSIGRAIDMLGSYLDVVTLTN